MRRPESPRHHLRPRALVVAAAVLVAAQGVEAELWYIEPRAVLRTFYDDNVRLTPKDTENSFGAIVRARVELGRRTEVSEIGVNAEVDSRHYSDVSELDRTNGALSAAWRYRLDRHRVGLDGTFDYDSTLTSEEETTGFVQVNKRRSRFFIRPSWRYAMSERTDVEAAFDYEDVSYEDVDVIPLFDYSASRASFVAGHGLSERLRLLGRVAYGSYDAPQIDTETSAYGLEAGAVYNWSETLSVSFVAGVRSSDSQTPSLDGGLVERNTTGPLFELNLKKDFLVGELDLTAERNLLPSSRGTLLDTTRLRLTFDYPVTSLWTFALDARAYRNRNPGGEVSGNDRDYVLFAPRLERRLSTALRLALGYRYRWQDREATAEDAASSNAVFLTLRYVFPREPLGRWSLLR